MDMRMGKQGMKFDTLDEIKLMLANRKQTKEVEKFANGGLLEGENLMPTGQLHARLHHMEDHNPELAANLTKKGIPIVSVSEDGTLSQVAEVEKEELILHLELTQQVEAL
jgi:CTP synthase (UTP-ammonia lyase)